MGLINFIWDEVSDNVLQETADGHTVEYSCEPTHLGGILSQRRSGTTYTYHYDGLGSTRQLTDYSGATTDAYAYDAWGVTLSQSGATTNSFRFCGQYGYYTDATSAGIYVRARQYVPTVSRWMSAEPVLSSADYIYASNTPAQLIDPSGLIPVAPLTVTVGDRDHICCSCGGFYVQWDFTLPRTHWPRGERELLVVQRICIRTIVTECRILGCECKTLIPYRRECCHYEYLGVRGRVAGDVTPWNDQHASPEWSNTGCGSIGHTLVTGDVRVFAPLYRSADGTVTDIKSEIDARRNGWKGPGFSKCGSGYGVGPPALVGLGVHNDDEPKWWYSKAIVARADTVTYSEWDCCPGDKDEVYFRASGLPLTESKCIVDPAKECDQLALGTAPLPSM